MKIRAKNLKAKLPQGNGDFSKKKVKVGRKVKRANVTEIKVKSKKIHIPLQNQISIQRSEDEREALNLLIKQLHHYNQPNKVSALQELKELLSESVNAESFIGLTLPEIMELIFDDEKEVRVAVTELVSFLLVKFRPDSFVAVIPVAITYLCSGLTSIHKGIRKDSLILLQSFAENGSHLLMPFLEKLIRHVVALLQESFQSVTVNGGSQDAHVAMNTHQQQQQINNAGKDSNNNSGSRNDKKGNQPASKTASVFILSLKVLQLLLAQNNEMSSAGVSVGGYTQLDFLSSSQHNSALVMSSKARSVCRWLQKAKNQSSSVAVDSNKSGKADDTVKNHTHQSSYHAGDGGSVPEDLAVEICHRLKLIWSGLVLDSNAVALGTIAILQEITKIALSIEQAFPNKVLPEFRAFVSVAFEYFPHTSIEASLSQPGSVQEKSGNLAAQLLDISLCEIMFVCTSTLNSASAITDSSVSDGAMDVVGEDSSSSARTSSSSQAAMEGVQTEAAAYLLESLQLHLASLGTVSSKKRVKTSETNVEIVTRIFSSFQLMVSFSTIGVMTDLLRMLNTQLFARIPGNSEGSQQVLYSYLTEPATLCICDIVTKLFAELSSTAADAQSAAQRDAVYVLLCEALTKLLSPAFVVRHLSKASAESPSTLVHSVFTAVVNMVRRVPSPVMDEDDEEDEAADGSQRSAKLDRAVSALTEAYCGLIEYTHVVPASDEDEDAEQREPFYVYRHSSEAMRYLLLDIYAQTQFADEETLLRITKSFAKVASNSSASSAEQTYFLRILYERRQELSIADFVDVLFTSLRMYMMSTCAATMDNRPVTSADSDLHTAMLRTALDVSSHWYVCHMTEQLRWIASSENPTKIIAYIMARLLALRDAAITADGYQYRCAAIARKDEAKGAKWMSQFGWLGCYMASTAVLNIAQYLLASVDVHTVLDDAGRATLHELLAVVRRVSLAVMTDELSGQSLALSAKGGAHMTSSSAVEGELVNLIASLVVSPGLPSTQSLLAGHGEFAAYSQMLSARDSKLVCSPQYAMFTNLLVEVTSAWRVSTSAAARVRLLRCVKTVLTCRSVSFEVVNTMRSEVLVVLRIFCDSSHEINAGRDAGEFDNLFVLVRDIIDSI